jgi:hypothetical protein
MPSYKGRNTYNRYAQAEISSKTWKYYRHVWVWVLEVLLKNDLTYPKFLSREINLDHEGTPHYMTLVPVTIKALERNSES